MATLESEGRTVKLNNGDRIRDASEELNVPFGCRSGFCGTCRIEILEGKDNLSQLTKEEKEMGDRDESHRLACQAIIKSGKVKLRIEGF